MGNLCLYLYIEVFERRILFHFFQHPLKPMEIILANSKGPLAAELDYSAKARFLVLPS